jgi:hypothetical protein
MSPTEWNYAIDNQEMLAIVMTCCHGSHDLEGARHPVEVLTDYYNLKRLMTTNLLRG